MLQASKYTLAKQPQCFTSVQIFGLLHELKIVIILVSYIHRRCQLVILLSSVTDKSKSVSLEHWCNVVILKMRSA